MYSSTDSPGDSDITECTDKLLCSSSSDESVIDTDGKPNSILTFGRQRDFLIDRNDYHIVSSNIDPSSH